MSGQHPPGAIVESSQSVGVDDEKAVALGMKQGRVEPPTVHTPLFSKLLIQGGLWNLANGETATMPCCVNGKKCQVFLQAIRGFAPYADRQGVMAYNNEDELKRFENEGIVAQYVDQRECVLCMMYHIGDTFNASVLQEAHVGIEAGTLTAPFQVTYSTDGGFYKAYTRTNPQRGFPNPFPVLELSTLTAKIVNINGRDMQVIDASPMYWKPRPKPPKKKDPLPTTTTSQKSAKPVEKKQPLPPNAPQGTVAVGVADDSRKADTKEKEKTPGQLEEEKQKRLALRRGLSRLVTPRSISTPHPPPTENFQ